MPDSPWHLLPLSAATAASLDALRLGIADALDTDAGLDLADLAYTLQVEGDGLGERLAVLGRNGSELSAALRSCSGEGWIGAKTKVVTRPVAFLFPGVGEQHINMGKDLYTHVPDFRDEMDYCLDRLDSEMETDFRAIMFDDEWVAPTLQQAWLRGASMLDKAAAELNRTIYAQPSMFVIEYCLAQQLMRWGVLPGAVLGYSLGEFVAATIAGVMSIDDALRMVAGRARLVEALPHGAMLAVPMAAGDMASFLSDELSVGISNGPKLCVVSGEGAAVAELEASLKAIGVVTRRLVTTHAFHSPMMRPAADGLRALLRTVALRLPRMRCLSNVSGTWLTDAEATDPEYWLRHLCQTARFAECLDALLDTEHDWVMVEVGPGQNLGALVRQRATLLRSGRSETVIPTMRAPFDCEDDRLVLMRVPSRLWVEGIDPDWSRFYADMRYRRVPLPAGTNVPGSEVR